MADLQLSIVLWMSHQLATGETVHLNHQFITPDLLFCGITKLQDYLEFEDLRKLGLPEKLIPIYQAETVQVLELLCKFNIEIRDFRRKLREKIGNGGYTPSDDQNVIHRSEDSRKAFDRAAEIAVEVKAPIISLQHLFAALLEIEQTNIRELFSEEGIEWENLCNEAKGLPTIVSSMEGRQTGGIALEKYGTDLTQKARENQLSPVVGRKKEMMAVIRTLSRNKKNNPILIGEAGVGKTAIVEGLAQRIASGNIHPDFQTKRIIQINAADLVAGTELRGDFEERMQDILKEVRKSPDVILFIDEIHMLVGAGAVSSNMDAANILKPALARGEIRLIGATTEEDFHKSIEKDAALERRFQIIRVLEPDQEETFEILKGSKEHLEQHHQVNILVEAIEAAIKLSVRYLPEHRLPDKAHDLLDEACAWVKYGSNISFDGNMGANDTPNCVDANTLREVVAEKTGIPVAQMSNDEAGRMKGMPIELRRRIIGQDEAIDAVTRAVQRHYTGMHEGKRPIGVFLFLGPTGVGKTELAKATANFLFGSDDRIVRINMSEFMEKHNVARLIGSPPGYIGYEEGGQLTQAVRKSPFSVVLLDEFEKAHPDIANIFLQVFSEGQLTDGQGKTVDMSNALFIMTSNLGYKPADNTENNKGEQQDEQMKSQEILRAVNEHFSPEFLNRIDEMVIFKPLDGKHLTEIAQIQLHKVQTLLREREVSLEWRENVTKWLAKHGYNAKMGARSLIRLIDKEVKNEIGRMILDDLLKPSHILEIEIAEDHLQVNVTSHETKHYL